MNWSMRQNRYPYLMMVFTIGDPSFPNGQPLNRFVSLGVPTRSIITELVSQYAAVYRQPLRPNRVLAYLHKENHVIMSMQQLYTI